ncbi:MAG: hypothetical protein KBS59_03540 [Clostridiales bacterium]|nr:hypothetical protein [Clostridiales bacterium]
MSERTLLELFEKFTPNQNERAIMERAVVSGPILADKEQRIVEVGAKFPMIFPKKTLYALEDAIASSYKLKYVRINPKYESGLFSDEYFSEIMTEARRRDIISDSFLKNYKMRKNDNDIVIETGFGNGGIILLNAADTASKISKIISDEFGLLFNITFDKNDDIYTGERMTVEKRIEALRSNTARQNQPVRQSVEAVKVASSVYKDNPELTVEDGTVKTGYMKFDITNAELLIGEDFEIVPSRLHDAPSLSGRAVFIG